MALHFKINLKRRGFKIQFQLAKLFLPLKIICRWTASQGKRTKLRGFFLLFSFCFVALKILVVDIKVTDRDRRSLEGLPIDFHLIVKPSPIFLLSIFFSFASRQSFAVKSGSLSVTYFPAQREEKWACQMIAVFAPRPIILWWVIF